MLIHGKEDKDLELKYPNLTKLSELIILDNNIVETIQALANCIYDRNILKKIGILFDDLINEFCLIEKETQYMEVCEYILGAGRQNNEVCIAYIQIIKQLILLNHLLNP